MVFGQKLKSLTSENNDTIGKSTSVGAEWHKFLSVSHSSEEFECGTDQKTLQLYSNTQCVTCSSLFLVVAAARARVITQSAAEAKPSLREGGREGGRRETYMY